MSDAIPPGTICHLEIPAPDLELAKAFYSGVFGWELSPMGDDYVLFTAGSSGGGLDRTAQVATCDGGCVLVIAVEDIDAKLEEIQSGGGVELKGKTEIGGGHGFYAYFRDPNGNKLGIWSKA